jgi:hypothetical protein
LLPKPPELSRVIYSGVGRNPGTHEPVPALREGPNAAQSSAGKSSVRFDRCRLVMSMLGVILGIGKFNLSIAVIVFFDDCQSH